MMKQFCTTCGKAPRLAYQPFCDCGGMMDVAYDLARVELHDSPNPYVRFADLLPIKEMHRRLPAEAGAAVGPFRSDVARRGGAARRQVPTRDRGGASR